MLQWSLAFRRACVFFFRFKPPVGFVRFFLRPLLSLEARKGYYVVFGNTEGYMVHISRGIEKLIEARICKLRVIFRFNPCAAVQLHPRFSGQTTIWKYRVRGITFAAVKKIRWEFNGKLFKKQT